MKTLSFDERSRQIREKIASGVRIPPAELLVNTGRRRSEEKRNLLVVTRRRLEEEGKAPAFKAKY